MIKIISSIFILTAIWIWVRDFRWLEESVDTIAILCVFPLTFYLGKPFKINEISHLNIDITTLFGTIVFLVGILFNITLFMALGWTLAFYSFISIIASSEIISLKRLILLPLMGFPWVTLDLNIVGWFYRLTGAWSAAKIFNIVGLNVEQRGTFLEIEGLTVSVEAACSGMNLMQSLLIGGVSLAIIYLRKSKHFWSSICLLPAIVWISNTIRIIFITVIGLIYGVETAGGIFHTIGGMVVVFTMFLICILMFRLFADKSHEKFNLSTS